MSIIQTRLSLMAFGTAKKKAMYKSTTLRMIDATLNTKSAHKKIVEAVGTNVNKSVVVNDLHISGDSTPHYTVDLYNQFEPVGCAHIYSAGQYKIFGPRTKAKKASLHGIKCSELL